MTRSAIVSACAALALATACGGADGSPLLAPQDGGVTLLDVANNEDSASNADATLPPTDASTSDAASSKDAATPKDAGNPYQDPGIGCGTSNCAESSDLCCVSITSYYPQLTYAYACEPLTDLAHCPAGIPIYCDDDQDCSGGQVCCGDLGYQQYSKVSCKATCTGVVYGAQQIHFCNPKQPLCDSGQTCKPSMVMTGYFVCQ